MFNLGDLVIKLLFVGIFYEVFLFDVELFVKVGDVVKKG